jgi:mevalonate kinase
MPLITASAPGKVILFGEHAVVYGQPALAVPVTQVQVRAEIQAAGEGTSVIEAPDVGLTSTLEDMPAKHPLLQAIRRVQEKLELETIPPFHLRITSTIPVAAGLGSGAAVSVAVARAVSTFLGSPLSDDQVSAIAYQVDQIYHGTPSGIDNTVIAYAQPIWYVRGFPFERLLNAAPFTILIANTGIKSSTGAVVSDLRERWLINPSAYDPIFARIGSISREARRLIESGQPESLGQLMNSNHDLLRSLDVSSPELDCLVEAAQRCGAFGAKLSGGGRGGNMIALAPPEKAPHIAKALSAAGATQVITTRVE